MTIKNKKSETLGNKKILTIKEEIVMKRLMSIILAVAMIITAVSVAPKVKAAVTYSVTRSYSNPVNTSGTATFEYVDGAVYFSNNKLTKYQLTLTDVAACSSEADQEICQFFDRWGTLWVIYRNEGIYWYNYEILKKGKLQKWAGISDSEKIYATRLAYDINESTTTIYDAGSLKYTGFTYVNYYTSGKNLNDYPLPDWYTLYRIINDEDYPTVKPTTEPTVTPTVEPTVVPTVVPTTDPTVAPTSEPTQAPTQNPTIEPTCPCGNGGKCTCPDGQCKCKDCKCSPEAPCHTATAAPVETPSNCNPADNNGESGDAIVDDNSNGNSNTGKNGGNGNNSVIIDGDGNTVVIVNPVEVHDDDTINNNDTDIIGDNNNVSSEQSGSDNDGNNVADTTGDGNVEAISQSSAGVTPQAKVATPSTVTGSTVEKETASSIKKHKVHYTVKHTKNYVQLIKHSGDGTCGAIHKVRFLRKKHICWINNKKYTKVYRVGYTKKSRQITLLKGGKKGYRKVIIIQRGSNQSNWKNRTLKGRFAGISAGSHGLDLRANTKAGKSVNLQNKTAIKL